MPSSFTPPVRSTDPSVLPDTPEWQRSPARYFHSPDGLIGKGVNVWVLDDGTVTETQPRQWSDVRTVYYGGHTYDVSDDEAALLTAAGYAANLTAGLSGYGAGLYGVGAFGG